VVGCEVATSFDGGAGNDVLKVGEVSIIPAVEVPVATGSLAAGRSLCLRSSRMKELTSLAKFPCSCWMIELTSSVGQVSRGGLTAGAVIAFSVAYIRQRRSDPGMIGSSTTGCNGALVLIGTGMANRKYR